MVSGSISLFYSKYFSPFPHGTGPLSVSQEYLALPDGAGSFTQDFSGPALLRILLGNFDHFEYGTFTLYDVIFQSLLLSSNSSFAVLQPQSCRNNIGLGLFPFAHHYLGNHYYFLLLRLLRCFSSPGLLPAWRDTTITRGGLPHSDIYGFADICSSP